LLIFFSKRY